MKKIYSKPETELLNMGVHALLQSISSTIDANMKQDLNSAGELDAEDTGGDNLGKGITNVWDAWD